MPGIGRGRLTAGCTKRANSHGMTKASRWLQGSDSFVEFEAGCHAAYVGVGDPGRRSDITWHCHKPQDTLRKASQKARAARVPELR
jgi:hypothetical protein